MPNGKELNSFCLLQWIVECCADVLTKKTSRLRALKKMSSKLRVLKKKMSSRIRVFKLAHNDF